MHLGNKLLIGVVLLSACKKDDKKKEEGGEAKGTAGGEAKTPAASGGGFEAKPVEFTWRRWTDNREEKFAIQANVPKGWKLMTEGENVKMLQTFMPADTDPKGGMGALYTTSSITYSSTCHGQCLGPKMAEQIAKVAKDRSSASNTSKVLQDGELSPGVWGYVIEAGYEGEPKQIEVGVTHYNPAWDSAVFCNAMLFKDDAKRYKEFLDACASTKFEVIDVVMGADRMKAEEANLAKCPAANKVTYTPKEAKPEEPVFTEVKAVRARSDQQGSVSLHFANVERTTGDDWDKPLDPGQGVIQIYLGLAAPGPTDDVLSGTYKNTSDAKGTASMTLNVTGGTGYTLGNNGGATVEIIARTLNKVCGKFIAEDEWRKAEGEFVADFEVRGY